jgi:hypothetical protein
MGKVLALIAGVLMIAVGLLWTLQGLDVVGGSSMSGDPQGFLTSTRRTRLAPC